MKILHLCLASFFIDNYSYQENLLPKYHKKNGLDVEIVASLVSFDKNGKACLLKKGGSYINEYEIPVTRLEYSDNKLSLRLRKYKNTYDTIVKAKPDIIFIHGCQFLDIRHVVKYKKENPSVKIFVDNHADFSNSARNWLSKNVLHKIIWRYCAKMIEPYTEKFWGVLPSRVRFLKDIYGINSNKIDYLPMGADDELVEKGKKDAINIREKYKIADNDFLIVTGGKIDSAKLQTLLLMDAVKNIKDSNVKLIIFGSVTPEIKERFNNLLIENKIIYAGWINSPDSYGYFAAADLVVFPGRHSVFWEQVVAQGKPLVVKHWDGTTHIDIGGNCIFLYRDTTEEIEQIISPILQKNNYEKMLLKANDIKKKEFCYSHIARKSLE